MIVMCTLPVILVYSILCLYNVELLYTVTNVALYPRVTSYVIIGNG